MPRSLAATLAALAFALVPATASAITWQEIVALSRAGVSSEVIVALIDRDKSTFPITPDQVIGLKAEGVSDAVVTAMLTAGATEPAPPGPTVVIVGRDPDRPQRTPGFGNPPLDPSEPVFVPYFVPVPYAIPVTTRPYCAVRPGVRRPAPSPTTGIFFATPFRGMFFDPIAPPSGAICDPTTIQTRPRAKALR